MSDLITYDKLSQQGTNPCAVNNGGCQQLCLVKGTYDYQPMSYQCSCETHFTLFKNNTCSGNEYFFLYYINNSIYSKKKKIKSQFIKCLALNYKLIMTILVFSAKQFLNRGAENDVLQSGDGH